MNKTWRKFYQVKSNVVKCLETEASPKVANISKSKLKIKTSDDNIIQNSKNLERLIDKKLHQNLHNKLRQISHWITLMTTFRGTTNE